MELGLLTYSRNTQGLAHQNKDMAPVDVCPENLTKVIEASEKLRCGNDTYGNNKYLCLPDVNKTSLVEFCYNGTIGLQEKGFCLQVSEGKLIHKNCVEFLSGCPQTPYMTSDFYKHSACQELNLDHHCYKFDPHCPPKHDTETNDTPDTISILVVCLGLAIVFIAFFCILFFCRHRLGKLWQRKKGQNESQYKTEEDNIQLLSPKNTGNADTDADLCVRIMSLCCKTVSQEKAITDKGNNSKEESTAEESKKETMGLHDKSTDGDNLTERQGQALDLAKNAAKEIRKCNNTEPTTYDVFYNVIRLMKLAKMFADNPEMSILELRPACSILAEVFRENECSLGHIKKLSDQQEEYLKLLDDTGKNIWTKAQSYEDCLIGANFCFAKIEDHSEDLIDRLQNTFCEKEIVFFLSTLQSEVKKLMSTTEEKAARQATAYVNLCCKIAILHSFVLWQAFCIMNRSALYQPSTKVVLAMINHSQSSNLNMLKCITEPKLQNAVFLSVFNITENENVKHLLEMQGTETHLDKRFYDQTYKIQWVHSPDVNLKWKDYADSFCGSKDFDKFQFEYVEGREFDNVCYIRNESRPGNPYMGITKYGYCREFSKNSSNYKVKWKLISFGKNEKNRRFIVASADWPDRFLYLTSATGCVKCKKQKLDPQNIGKGLWEILEVEQATMKKR